MPLIPAALRAPLNKVGGGLSVSGLFAANPGAVTLGIAAAQAGPSVVEVGGVRAAAAPYASAAVAVTRIERRGSRIWGALCSGVGPVEQAVTTGGQSSTLPFLYGTRHSPWTRSGPWTNPLQLAADVVIGWDSTEQVRSNMPLGHYRISVGRFAPGQSLDVFNTVMGWLNANIGYAAAQIDNGTVTAQVPAVTTRAANWQTAPATLAWASVGLQWWGLVEAAARSGSWVRRLAWTDASRAIRFEAGSGTTRAVAVQMASGLAVAERVTTADFGVAEFLAEDWVVLSANEAPLVDVTDFVFSGPVGTVFFVVFGDTSGWGAGGGGTVGSPAGGGNIGGIYSPQTGRGFVYVRDGVLKDDRVLVGVPTVREILIRSMGVQEDDLRVRVRGVTVFDTRYNVGWYRGETFLTAAIPPIPAYDQADHWRVARVTEAMLAVAGEAAAGDLVEVDVFDGWGGAWRTAPWVATVTWTDGRVTTCTGGVTSTGESAQPAVADVVVTPSAHTLYGGETVDVTGGSTATYSEGLAACGLSTGVRLNNPTGATLGISVSGSVDDDVLFNGSIYEPGAHPFPWTVWGSPCGSDNTMNGVHSFAYSGTIGPFSDFRIQGKDNGFGGSISCSVTITTVSPAESYFATGPHFSTYVPNGNFRL